MQRDQKLAFYDHKPKFCSTCLLSKICELPCDIFTQYFETKCNLKNVFKKCMCCDNKYSHNESILIYTKILSTSVNSSLKKHLKHSVVLDILCDHCNFYHRFNIDDILPQITTVSWYVMYKIKSEIMYSFSIDTQINRQKFKDRILPFVKKHNLSKLTFYDINSRSERKL